MIPASEALQLLTAQLSADEIEAANRLEYSLDQHVRQSMQFQGCLFITKEETRESVVVEVGRRAKAAGYLAQWMPITQQHRFNTAMQEVVGWRFVLMPSEEAYRDAARSALS